MAGRHLDRRATMAEEVAAHALVELRRSKRIRNEMQRHVVASPDQSTTTTAAAKFMAIVNDDLLREVLIRLPHALSAIQCSTVCKRWLSLISSDCFIRGFVHRSRLKWYSDSSYSPPFTFLFVFIRGTGGPKIDDIVFTSHQLYKKIPRGIHCYSESTRYLDFLPEPWPHAEVTASSDDLLLVTHWINFRIQCCVCNPLTRRWLLLPQIPPWLFPRHRFGLVCSPNSSSFNKRLDFKVVNLRDFSRIGANFVFDLAVFCSEEGLWSQLTIEAPIASVPEFHSCIDAAITSKGVLYYPLSGMAQDLTGFVALDHEGAGPRRCCFIGVPVGFCGGWRARKGKVCIGVVRGRLRISQFLKAYKAFDLNVWELSDDFHDHDGDAASWVLVHSASLRREMTMRMFVVAFDPNDSNVIFMIRNNSICRYRTGDQDNYEEVGELPNFKCSNYAKEHLNFYLNVFLLVHT